MRVNVYSDEWNGEWEVVDKDKTEDGGEFLDGIRIVTKTADGLEAESAVTIWINPEGYERMADTFEAMAAKVRDLAEVRSRP